MGIYQTIIHRYMLFFIQFTFYIHRTSRVLSEYDADELMMLV